MQAVPPIDVAYEEVVIKAVQAHPDWDEYLRNMVTFESAMPRWAGDEHYWLWQDTRTPPATIGAMIIAGLVTMVSNSRSGSLYVLRDRNATRSALDTLRSGAPAGEPILDIDDLFSPVVGLEKEKQLLRYAIMSDRPVHAILVGPPATAKSLMLSDIGRLPGAEYYIGGSISKSGLVGFLLAERPKILVVDELNTMSNEDAGPLLSLMSDGLVTRLHHGQRQRTEMPTKVFAGANTVAKFLNKDGSEGPLLSRFAKLHLAPYTTAEFIEVTCRVLESRENMGPNVAMFIARSISPHTSDPRDAVRVARMSLGDPLRATEVIRTMWGKGPVTRVK